MKFVWSTKSQLVWCGMVLCSQADNRAIVLGKNKSGKHDNLVGREGVHGMMDIKMVVLPHNK